MREIVLLQRLPDNQYREIIVTVDVDALVASFYGNATYETYEKNDSKVRRLGPLTGNTDAASAAVVSSPSLTRVEQPPVGGPAQGDLRSNAAHADDIRELRSILADLSQQLAVLQRRLGPVDAEEKAIKDRLVETHQLAAPFSDSLKATRAPLFDRLTDLSIRHGAARTDRKRLLSRQHTLQRDIETAEKKLQAQKGRANANSR